MSGANGIELPNLGYGVVIERPSGHRAADDRVFVDRADAVRRAVYLGRCSAQLRKTIVAPWLDWSALPGCGELLRIPDPIGGANEAP